MKFDPKEKTKEFRAVINRLSSAHIFKPDSHLVDSLWRVARNWDDELLQAVADDAEQLERFPVAHDFIELALKNRKIPNYVDPHKDKECKAPAGLHKCSLHGGLLWIQVNCPCGQPEINTFTEPKKETVAS
jgi:hypothetical protein